MPLRRADIPKPGYPNPYQDMFNAHENEPKGTSFRVLAPSGYSDYAPSIYAMAIRYADPDKWWIIQRQVNTNQHSVFALRRDH
ncbi:MAG: hypothetical protein ACRESZ_03415 [Methylococcales bacterium]